MKTSTSSSTGSRQHPSCLHLPAPSRHQQQSSRGCHQPRIGMNKRSQQADNVRPSFRTRLECSAAEHGMQAARPQGQRRPAGCPRSTGRSGSCTDAAAHADTARCAGIGLRNSSRKVATCAALGEARDGIAIVCCFFLTQPSTYKPIWGCERYCYPSAQSCSDIRLLQLGLNFTLQAATILQLLYASRQKDEHCMHCLLT